MALVDLYHGLAHFCGLIELRQQLFRPRWQSRGEGWRFESIKDRNAVELRLRTETQTALNQWSTAMQEVESYDKTILPSAQQAVDTANEVGCA